MDQILLDALNNLSLSLDQIAQALISRGDNSQSATTTALQSGDFSNQMMEISRGVQSIKADTQKILDNQATLIKMQKEKESEKTDIFDESGKKKSLVKDGVGSIILIAGAVLAIGLAFSVIGSVDWVSVMALSISLPLIAFAFEKIASIKELTTGRMMELAGVVTIMSLSILASSYILGGVQSVGISQLFTAVMVAGTLGVISLTIGGLFNSIKDISMVDALKASFIMPLVMMSMSYAIAQSS